MGPEGTLGFACVEFRVGVFGFRDCDPDLGDASI